MHMPNEEICPKCLQPIKPEQAYTHDDGGRKTHVTCPNQIPKPL